MMHPGIIKTLCGIMIEESIVPKVAIIKEAKGLRPKNATRPGNIVMLDFVAERRHLIFDDVVTTVYRNGILTRVAAVPMSAAKLMEDKKFKAYADSPRVV